MRALLVFLLVLPLCAGASDKWSLVRPMQYSGMADASGAVAVSSNLLVVADDESNVLRLYRADLGGPPLREFDCNPFLELSGKSIEADLEAGARIGDRAFWIGSHGRNKNGKARPNRGVLFATDIHGFGEQVMLVPAGRPYKRLLEDLNSDSRFARFNLAAAALLEPKASDALNIEGLSATPDGHLLIGFRNPIPQGKALLIPLLNPQKVIEGAQAEFGPAELLALDGLGIRDIALWQQAYLIVAGPDHGGGPFHFYEWAGGNAAPRRLRVHGLADYHPEALIVYPDKGLDEVQVLSDDGRRSTDGVSAREIPWTQKTFRSFWLQLGHADPP